MADAGGVTLADIQIGGNAPCPLLSNVDRDHTSLSDVLDTMQTEIDGETALADGKIVVGNGSGVATDVDMSGDVTIINDGTTTIGADTVANTMLENMTRGTVKTGGTSDAPTDLDCKTDGYIMVGDGTDIASVAVSGDVTLANTGAVTIATGAVEDSMIEALASGEILIGVDGTAANNAKVTTSGDAIIANDGAITIQEGAVEDSMIEGLTAGQIILGVDGTAANNLIAVLSGDVTMDGTGAVTIATGAVEDSMIEGLTAGQIILGVDGTAANNLIAVLSGDVTMDGTGAVTIATGAVEDSMIEGLAAGQIILGVDGTAANNLISVLSGDVTMDATGAVTIAAGAVDESMIVVPSGDGLNVKRIARATYSYAEHGGAVSTIGLGVTLPDNAVVTRTWYEVITTLTSNSANDAATVNLHIPTDDADGLVAAVAISAATDWDAGLHEGIQDGTVANFAEKCTAARELSVTIGVEAIDAAGIVVFFCEYVVSD